MLEKLRTVTIGSMIDLIGSVIRTVKEGLSGKKTYLMIGVTVVDQLGSYAGLWEPDQLRLIAEGGLWATALRAGVGK